MIVKEDIESIIRQSLQTLEYDDDKVEVKFSSMPDLADFQYNNSFKIAKKMGKSPMEIAQSIVCSISDNDMFEFSAVKPAYVNVKLTKNAITYYANIMLKDDNMCVKKVDKPEIIFMDYGGANVAKALHMGHLRSPIIGEGLKRVFALFGNKVYSDVHFGDFGLQMGLTLAQLEDDGYFNFCSKNKTTTKNSEITLDLLNIEYPKASLRKKSEPDFKLKADDYTLKLQNKQEPYYSAYLQIREISVKEINKYYNLLNTHFDFLLGESDAAPYIDTAVQIFMDKGLAYNSGGALVCDVAEEGEHIPIPKNNDNEEQKYKNPMPPVLLKKYNGGDLYATTDIATIYQRNKDFHPDKIIYVADNRQKQHFTQVFRACKKAGISPKGQELIYVPFGTMNGKDGKAFKTRGGDVVKLEDVYTMVVNKAQEKLKSNGVEDSNDLARMIGVSALKYGDLSNTISKDYIFDIDKFLSFEGKTGPYIQYNGARINSLLAKSDVEQGEINVLTTEESNIVINILKQIESYEICKTDLSLNALCLALYNVASAFSQFYNNINILKEKDVKRKQNLLAICSLVLKALKQGLNTLAIDMPEKM